MRYPGLIERVERRTHPRVLPVVGMIVAEHDQIDTHLVECLRHDRRRLNEKNLARICVFDRQVPDHGFEVDNRQVRRA